MTRKEPCTWSEPMLEMLRSHWETGISSSQSAKAINEAFGTSLSRSSIIGKRYRLGLSRNVGRPFRNNPVPVRPDPTTRLRRAVKSAETRSAGRSKGEIERLRRAAEREAEMHRSNPVMPLSVYTRDAVMSLRRTSCRFPIGVLGAPDFRFCCEPQVAGSSYCAEHRAICAVPIPARANADGARN